MPALVVATLTHVSGFPEDDYVNTFAISTDPATPLTTSGGELTIPIASFYNTLYSGMSVSNFLNGSISRAAGALKMKVYDLDGKLSGNSALGSPSFEDTGTLNSPLEPTFLPEEVALKLTWRGENWDEQPVEEADGGDPGTTPDRPRARHTGGIYVGPFIDVVAVDGANKARPTTNLVNTLLNAAEGLQDALVANGHHLAVWSRSNANLRWVTHAQVDNSFDTQRRRGVAPTSRTTRVLLP